MDQPADTSKVQDYFYFTKLVPHVFVDNIDNTDAMSYSYSLNHNSKVKNNQKNLTLS